MNLLMSTEVTDLIKKTPRKVCFVKHRRYDLIIMKVPETLLSLVPAELPLSTLRSRFPRAQMPGSLAFPLLLWAVWQILLPLRKLGNSFWRCRGQEVTLFPSPFHANAFPCFCFILNTLFFTLCVLLTSSISGKIGLPNRSATSPV